MERIIAKTGGFEKAGDAVFLNLRRTGGKVVCCVVLSVVFFGKERLRDEQFYLAVRPTVFLVVLVEVVELVEVARRLA